jgi:hypothetical protein
MLLNAGPPRREKAAMNKKTLLLIIVALGIGYGTLALIALR